MRLQSAQHCTALHNAVFLKYGQVDFSKATESISDTSGPTLLVDSDSLDNDSINDDGADDDDH